MTTPSTKTVLSVLTKDPLADVGRSVGVPLPKGKKKHEQVRLTETGRVDFILTRLRTAVGAETDEEASAFSPLRELQKKFAAPIARRWRDQ